MRKLIALLTAMLMLSLSLSGCNGEKADVPPETETEPAPEWMGWPESPLEDFEYERSDDGLSMHIRRYLGSDEVVVIPSHIEGLPVTSLTGWSLYFYDELIKKGAFEYSGIKTVVLPDTLISIGEKCFYQSVDLTAVYIMPDSNLRVIGDKAFTNCLALETLDLSDTSLEKIEEDALNGCSNLPEIHLPDTLTEIGDEAFAACFALRELDLPDNLVSLGFRAFLGCKALWRVTIPAKLDLTANDGCRFLSLSSLYSLSFDEGRESIEGLAYFEFKTTVDVTIPASVRTFSPGVFTVWDEQNIHIRFQGDCPEIVGDANFDPNAMITIYYDPDTAGWEDCVWKDRYEMIPERPIS